MNDCAKNRESYDKLVKHCLWHAINGDNCDE